MEGEETWGGEGGGRGDVGRRRGKEEKGGGRGRREEIG